MMVTRVHAVTIPSGESTTPAIDIAYARDVAVVFPAVWASAGLAVLVSPSEDGTYVPLCKTADGAEEAVSAASDKAIPLPAGVAAFRFIKLLSGTTASEVNQDGPKAGAVLTVSTGKTLTVGSGEGGLPSNLLKVRIEVSDDDDLHVSNPEGTSTILIKLAHTTAADNEDTKIEAAVQALSEVAGVDVSAMTVAGNAAYDDAEPVGSALGSPAGCVLDFGDSKTLTISSGLPGSWYNALSFAVETAENDVLAVAHNEGVITISLANETGTNNEASDIQALVQALTVAGLDMTAFTVTGSDEYNAAEPISGEIAATPMTGGEELITEATLEGGDDTHLFVVCKA
jgi:hypothetical protein